MLCKEWQSSQLGYITCSQFPKYQEVLAVKRPMTSKSADELQDSALAKVEFDPGQYSGESEIYLTVRRDPAKIPAKFELVTLKVSKKRSGNKTVFWVDENDEVLDKWDCRLLEAAAKAGTWLEERPLPAAAVMLEAAMQELVKPSTRSEMTV